MLTRRELLTGAAAVGAFAALPDDVEAMGRRQRHVLLGTVGASAYAPYPAPPGYHWEFVTSAANGGQRVTSAAYNNQPVVSLRAN